MILKSESTLINKLKSFIKIKKYSLFSLQSRALYYRLNAQKKNRQTEQTRLSVTLFYILKGNALKKT